MKYKKKDRDDVRRCSLLTKKISISPIAFSFLFHSSIQKLFFFFTSNNPQSKTTHLCLPTRFQSVSPQSALNMNTHKKSSAGQIVHALYS
jgi:hypothetical protein